MEKAVKQPLESCPQCGCADLFIRKDFPQKLGLAIVVVAGLTFLVLAANPHTFYLGAYALAGAVVVDALLYFIVPKMTICYKCRGAFREEPINPRHGGFELSIGEKYRGDL